MKSQEDIIPPEYWEDRDWAWDHYAEFIGRVFITSPSNVT
jgi:hypothetical protein